MRMSAPPWIGAGVALAAYPALRPYTDETTLTGLAAIGSARWVLAHVLGMIGFALLAYAIRSTLLGRHLSFLAGLAVVGLLPYYGAESFGLTAVGRYAVATGDVGLVQVVDGFRYGPAAMVCFLVGLTALAAVGVLMIIRFRSEPALPRAAATLVGLTLVLYLPQFFAAPGVRIGHGLLLGLGCVLLGLLLDRPNAQNNRGESEPSSSISQRLVSSS